jgi:hypothetical protein
MAVDRRAGIYGPDGSLGGVRPADEHDVVSPNARFQRVERILRVPILGGLHHEYIRGLICDRHKPKEPNFETDYIFLSRR